MPSQYDIDTKFIEFLLRIVFTLSVFCVVFLMVLIPQGMKYAFVQNMYVLFIMLFVMLLGIVFGLFIMWFRRYRTSYFKRR